MKAFVDASIVVAIVGREGDWQQRADLLDQHGPLLWSAVSRWESSVVLRRRLNVSVDEARLIVDDFGALNGIETCAIGSAESDAALDAFARFGKGTGHPAQLNMGDCFAYACAKVNDARLLYKGDDFSQTDLA